MNKIKLNLEKNKKYVVACSFGPDSMALLSLAIENGYNIVVAHVNYRKRDASEAEQRGLLNYCGERNIKVYVLDLMGVKHSGNFQDWAREKRYHFFKDVLKKESADAVLVAHQEDDVIETYLMQKKRGNFSKFAGITGEIDLFGIKIIRPLLAYSKQDLLDYNAKNNVPFSIDESNLKDEYTRNKIRHNVVEKMTKEERKQILKEIQSIQKGDVEKKTVWTKQEFLNLSYEQVVQLFDFFMEKINEHEDLSVGYVNEIKKAFASKSNCLFNITTGLIVEKDYGFVYIVNAKRLQKYSFKFEKKLENEIFEIDFTDGAADRNIPDTSKELIVKNIENNEKIIIRDYSSHINRLLIDWKVPHYLRKVWPGIYSNDGKLLYVPRYRREFVDNHKSKFVFKTDYYTEF